MANGIIHSSDEGGKLVFKADTRGGKWSLEVREKNRGYAIYDYKSGGMHGMGGDYSEMVVRDRIINTILDSKKIDSINYIIEVDEIGVSERLERAEKVWVIENGKPFIDWKKTLTKEKTDEFKRKAMGDTSLAITDGAIAKEESEFYARWIYKKEVLLEYLKQHENIKLEKGGMLNGEGQDMMEQMNSGDDFDQFGDDLDLVGDGNSGNPSYRETVGESMMDEMAKGGEIKTSMRKVNSLKGYDYYIGKDKDGKKFYNIVPTGSKAPAAGYYSKKFISTIKLVSELGFPEVDGFNLVYEKSSKMMGGNGTSGTIRTSPENYYVATVGDAGELSFDGIEANTKNIDKARVQKMYDKGLIPSSFARGGEVGYEILEPSPLKVVGFLEPKDRKEQGLSIYESTEWDKQHGAQYRIGSYKHDQYIFDEATGKLRNNPLFWSKPAIKVSAKQLMLMGDDETWDSGEKIGFKELVLVPNKRWHQNHNLYKWAAWKKEKDKGFKLPASVDAVFANGGEVEETERIITVPNATALVAYWDSNGDVYADGKIGVSFKDFNKVEVSIYDGCDRTIDEAVETVESIVSSAKLYEKGGDVSDSEKYAKGGEVSKASAEKFYKSVNGILVYAQSFLDANKYSNEDVNGIGVTVKLRNMNSYSVEDAIAKLAKKHKLTKQEVSYLENEFDESWSGRKFTSWKEFQQEFAPDNLIDQFPLLDKKEIGFYGRSGGHLVFADASDLESTIDDLRDKLNSNFDNGKFAPSEEGQSFKDFIADDYSGKEILEMANSLALKIELYSKVVSFIEDGLKDMPVAWKQELDFRLDEAYQDEKDDLKESAKDFALANQKAEAKAKAVAEHAESNPPFAKHRNLILTDDGQRRYRVNYLGHITQYGNKEFSGGWKLIGLVRVDYDLNETILVLDFSKMTEEAIAERVAYGYYDEGKLKYTIRDRDYGTLREWGNHITNMHFEDVAGAPKGDGEKFHRGGDVKKSVLGKEYLGEFTLKGNGHRKYNIFQLHGDDQCRQAAKKLFPNMSYAEHKKLADKYFDLYKQTHKLHWETIEKEFKKQFGRDYHATDYKVSGIARDEFSEDVKKVLRGYLDKMGELAAAMDIHNCMLNKADKVSRQSFAQGGELETFSAPQIGAQMTERLVMAEGGSISDSFELGTPAVYHSYNWRNEPVEQSGEIVMRDGVKGISLYRDRNYSGSGERFIVPNWQNVESFYQANNRKQQDKKFDIVGVKFARGGSVSKVAKVLVISSKNPLSLQLSNLTGHFYNAYDFEDLYTGNPLVIKHKDSGEIFVAFTSTYFMQVDEHVIENDLSYVKSTYHVSSFDWVDKAIKHEDGGSVASDDKPKFDDRVLMGYNDYCNAIYNSPTGGLNKATAQKDFVEHNKTQLDLNEGRIAPAKVVGGGYKNGRKVAENWINAQIEKTQKILDTNGRSNIIIQSNFISNVAAAKNTGAITPAMAAKLLFDMGEYLPASRKEYAESLLAQPMKQGGSVGEALSQLLPSDKLIELLKSIEFKSFDSQEIKKIEFVAETYNPFDVNFVGKIYASPCMITIKANGDGAYEVRVARNTGWIGGIAFLDWEYVFDIPKIDFANFENGLRAAIDNNKRCLYTKYNSGSLNEIVFCGNEGQLDEFAKGQGYEKVKSGSKIYYYNSSKKTYGDAQLYVQQFTDSQLKKFSPSLFAKGGSVPAEDAEEGDIIEVGVGYFYKVLKTWDGLESGRPDLPVVWASIHRVNKNGELLKSEKPKNHILKFKYKKGGSVEKTEEKSQQCSIRYLNKEKGFKQDEKTFDSYEEAVTWGRANLDNFHSDMVSMKFENGGGVTAPRIEKMLKNWKEIGKAFSALNNDDNEFFEKVGVPYDKLGITSQTGNDIVYYDTNIWDIDLRKKNKMASGGGLDSYDAKEQLVLAEAIMQEVKEQNEGVGIISPFDTKELARKYDWVKSEHGDNYEAAAKEIVGYWNEERAEKFANPILKKVTDAITKGSLKILRGGEKMFGKLKLSITELVWARNFEDGFKIEVYSEGLHIGTIDLTKSTEWKPKIIYAYAKGGSVKKELGQIKDSVSDIEKIECYYNFSVKGNANQIKCDKVPSQMIDDYCVYLSDKEFLEKYSKEVPSSFDDDDFEENGSVDEFRVTQEYYITFNDGSELYLDFGMPDYNFLSADARDADERTGTLAEKWLPEFNKDGWDMDIDSLVTAVEEENGEDKMAKGGALSLFTYDTAQEFVVQLNSEITSSWKSVQVSALGGKEHVSIILKISLDPKDKWTNGILHNSRYAMFHIHNNGVIECFSRPFRMGKFRKATVETWKQVIEKINKYVQENSAVLEKGGAVIDPNSEKADVAAQLEKMAKGGAVPPRWIGKALRIKGHAGAKHAGAVRRKAKALGWIAGEQPLTIEILERMKKESKSWNQAGTWAKKITLAETLIKMPHGKHVNK